MRVTRRDELDDSLGLVATNPVVNIHVGAYLSMMGSRPSLRQRIWSLQEGGRLVALIQHCRGVSWAVPEGRRADETIYRAVGKFLSQALSSSEVLFGPTNEVGRVLDAARLRGVYPSEIRRQLMMAIPECFSPRLPDRGGGFQLRRAEAADLPWLQETHSAMCLEDLGVDRVSQCPRSYRRYFLGLIDAGCSLVGQLGSEPVFKAETPLQSSGARLIEGVYTYPEFRGRGLASRALIEIVRAAARDERRACLYVNCCNRGAIRLYRRLGFRQVCEWTTALVTGDERSVPASC